MPYSGKVKWFNNTKGYGFAISDAFDEDLFVHYSSIHMEGYKTLKAGDDITFEIYQGPNGLHAINVSTENSQSRAEKKTLTEEPS